ncbi:MAG: hypothetical protein ACM3ZB_09025 [bacterium]
MRTAFVAGFLTVLAASVSFGQQAISAKSGMIHYVEGAVLLDGTAVQPKFGQFPHMSENSVLETTEGRAEVLLGPGVFLRVGENSRIMLLSDRITHTRFGLPAGSAVVEVVESNDALITVEVGDAIANIERAGVYRFDAEPGRIMVYDGQAIVEQGGRSQKVKGSRMLLLDGSGQVAKFNKKQGDALFRWAGRRAEYIARANVSSALRAQDAASFRPGWIWNPYFGMFTYVPAGGILHSFWGYNLWSPRTVYMVYTAPVRPAGNVADVSSAGTGWSQDRGYRTASPTSSGTSGVVAASSAAASSPSSGGSSSASAPVSRPSGRAAGRSR